MSDLKPDISSRHRHFQTQTLFTFFKCQLYWRGRAHTISKLIGRLVWIFGWMRPHNGPQI